MRPCEPNALPVFKKYNLLINKIIPNLIYLFSNYTFQYWSRIYVWKYALWTNYDIVQNSCVYPLPRIIFVICLTAKSAGINYLIRVAKWTWTGDIVMKLITRNQTKYNFIPLLLRWIEWATYWGRVYNDGAVNERSEARQESRRVQPHRQQLRQRLIPQARC